MKTYRFTTEKRSEVIIETEHSDVYYFGMYITCEAIGVSHKWHSPSVLQVYQSNFYVFSDQLKRVVSIQVPESIFSEIQNDYKETCTNTGKLIIATINTGDGMKFVKYGLANADVQFKGLVNYIAPKSMERSIRALSCDGNIYWCGHEDAAAVDYMIASLDKPRKFYIRHFSPAFPFLPEDSESDEDGTFEYYEITIEVVTPYKD